MIEINYFALGLAVSILVSAVVVVLQKQLQSLFIVTYASESSKTDDDDDDYCCRCSAWRLKVNFYWFFFSFAAGQASRLASKVSAFSWKIFS